MKNLILYFALLIGSVSGCAIATGGHVEGDGIATGGQNCLPGTNDCERGN